MRFRRLLPIAIVCLTATLSYSAFAFTAANTVPDSKAGEGTSTVSGYTITDINYSLNATNPSNIDQVAFTMSPAPPATGQVRIKANTQVYTCTTAGATATCATTTPQQTVTALTSLTVIAAD
jgi:hypothetical protein